MPRRKRLEVQESAPVRALRGPADGRRDEFDLEDLLREAEEALRESRLPSGSWGPARRESRAGSGEGTGLIAADGAEPAWLRRLSAVAGALSGNEDADAEAAFWLLFPPRGNA